MHAVGAMEGGRQGGPGQEHGIGREGVPSSIEKVCRVNYVLVVMLGRSTSYPKVRNPPTKTSDLLSSFIIINQTMEKRSADGDTGYEIWKCASRSRCVYAEKRTMENGREYWSGKDRRQRWSQETQNLQLNLHFGQVACFLDCHFIRVRVFDAPELPAVRL